jgi:hypothetical protein
VSPVLYYELVGIVQAEKKLVEMEQATAEKEAIKKVGTGPCVRPVPE